MSVSNIAKFIPTYRPYVDYQVVNLGLQRKDNEVYQYWDEYIKLAKESGYKLLSWNVWDKKSVGAIGLQRAMFPLVHEWVFVFGTEPFEINNTVEKSDKANIGLTRPFAVRQKDGSMKRGIKHFSSDPLRKMWTVLSLLSEHGEIRKDHPAVFPIAFPKAYIESMSNPGDIVIEPFCGSGSTLIACEETGRRCRGMELAPEYCDVIVERWEKLTGKKAELIA